MKFLVFIIALVVANVSQAGMVTVLNNTEKSTTLGNYRGFTLPSICESTGYGFCWEEVNVKFKSLSYNYADFKGSVSVDLSKQERTVLLGVDDQRPIEILNACEDYSDSPYVQAIEGTVLLSAIKKEALCLSSSAVLIIID